jgi:hypothetical protein
MGSPVKLSPGLAYKPTAACPENLLTTDPALLRYLLQNIVDRGCRLIDEGIILPKN